jgi:hypothetical protein
VIGHQDPERIGSPLAVDFDAGDQIRFGHVKGHAGWNRGGVVQGK